MTTQAAPPQAANPRPGWVWVISILYFLAVPCTLIPLLLVWSGTLPLPPAQHEYFQRLSYVDHAITLLIGTANLAGAIALFRLRRVAFSFLTTALAFTTVLSLWHAATKGWIQALGPVGLVGPLF